MAKKVRVTLEQVREVLVRKMDEPRNDQHKCRMNLVLDVIMQAIKDLDLEDKSDPKEQLEGRSARLFLFGTEGEKTLLALGIEPQFAWDVALKYNQVVELA